MTRRERQAASARPLPRFVAFAAVLSVVATLLAAGAVTLVLVRQPDVSACRPTLWNAMPAAGNLPTGWSIVSARFFTDNVSVTLAVPAASGATAGAAVYVSVNCYAGDAALALGRDRDGEAAAHAGKVAFPNLGDESFAASSASSGSTTVYIRRGGLVADVSASSSLDPSVLAAIARAVDRAMADALAGEQPSSIPLSDAVSPTPTPSLAPSPSPSSLATPAAVSHAAPDLEALLPHALGSTTLTSQSTLGTSVLSSDPASQSLVASLAKLGKTPADLQIAEAKDASGHLDLAVFAYRANGVTSAQLSAALADSLLAGSSSGVRSAATLAGRAVTKLSYSQGDIYLYAAGSVTFAIQTADQSIASEVIALLK